MAIFTLSFQSEVLTQEQLDDVVNYIVGEHFPEAFPDDFNPLLGAKKNWYLIATDSGTGTFEYSINLGYSSPSLKDRNNPKFLTKLAKLAE